MYSKSVVALTLIAGAADAWDLNAVKTMVMEKAGARVTSTMAPPKQGSQDNALGSFAFDAFVKKYNKVYASEKEKNAAKSNFLQNMRAADDRNALERRAGGTAIHGVTHLSDLSQSDFQAKFLTADKSMQSKGLVRETIPKAATATTGVVDWAGVYTTPVKDQGYCGSCWAFSATEQVESDGMRTLGTDFTLSPEQITQCDKTSYGCNGGWTEHAYNYLMRNGGLEQESSYPYTSYMGVTGTCSMPNGAAQVVTVESFSTLDGESSMTTYMQTTGPLSVCLDANNWNSYTGGIMKVCGQSVDHCVQAVGVDASSNGFWKVRNSWGTSWGEDGYIYLAYGENTCNIASDPTYTVVANP